MEHETLGPVHRLLPALLEILVCQCRCCTVHPQIHLSSVSIARTNTTKHANEQDSVHRQQEALPTFRCCIVCVSMLREHSHRQHQQRRELHSPHACQLCRVSKAHPIFEVLLHEKTKRMLYDDMTRNTLSLWALVLEGKLC